MSNATQVPSPIPMPDLSAWENEKGSLVGSLPYTLTNDFLFKYVLQQKLFALKGLLGSIFHMDPERIQSIIIQNPVTLGDHIDDKILILDMKLILDSDKIIDIEMQVAAQVFYPERALSYLCRIFDQLKSGNGYDQILPCIQVSLLCNSMFSKDDSRYTDDFYSEYILKEKVTNKEYSDKFRLVVLQLNHLEHASDKDDPNGLYQWAKLFNAKTWEDVKMIIENNNYMKVAASGIKELTADEKVRLACEARECAIMEIKTNYNAGKVAGVAEGEFKKEQELRPIIEAKDAALKDKDAEIIRLRALLSQ